MIATTIKNGVPLILGDMLISSSQLPAHFLLPTLFDNVIPYLPPSTDYPVDLRQKIYFLAPHVCAAFAGTVAHIKPFLEDVAMYCRYCPDIKGADLQAYVQQYVAATPLGDVVMQILVLDKMEGIPLMHIMKAGHWETGTSPLVGDITAAGSGAVDFIAMAELEANVLHAVEASQLHEQAILANVTLIVRILAQERAVLTTVQRYWGAGFEVAYAEGGDFHKLDDITFIIFQGQIDETGHIETPAPVLILYYKYHGDNLVITALMSPHGAIHVTETHYIFRYIEFYAYPFIVKPIIPMGDDRQPPTDTSFVSTRLAAGYLIGANGGYYIPASLHFEQDMKVEYRHQKSLIITMDKHIMETLIGQVKSEFSHEKKSL